MTNVNYFFFFFIYSRQLIIPESQLMYIVVKNSTFVIRVSYECLGLFLVTYSEYRLLIRLKLPSIIASYLLSAFRIRLYNSMFFTFILSLSITTLQNTTITALCTTFFLTTGQYILGLSPINSVMRCPLFRSKK